MKIVILDGYTSNPGDLDWKGIEGLGDLEVFDRTDASQISQRCAKAKVIFTNKVPVDEHLLESCPQLKYVGVLATGVNTIDVEACRKRGVTVTNVPSYSTESVAQLTLAHLLNLTNRVELHARSVRKGEWAQSDDFSYVLSPQVELHGKTLGILGLGQTGQAVARLGMALGMEVIAHNRNPKNIEGVREVSFDSLLQKSDVLSLHCPLTDATKGIIDGNSLKKMKRSSFLLNMGRGPLVVENDLAEAIESGVIAGAGLDVLSSEPCEENNPLTLQEKCHITPHLAWATREARTRLIRIATANLKAFLDGKPVNVVG